MIKYRVEFKCVMLHKCRNCATGVCVTELDDITLRCRFYFVKALNSKKFTLQNFQMAENLHFEVFER
jgi:hypothetical protein